MFQPWIVAIIIPLAVLAVPIVWMLTSHQRKMAEIIHKGQSVPVGELEAIRQELREMRGLMHQHTIALDDVRNKQGQLPPPETMQERLGAQ